MLPPLPVSPRGSGRGHTWSTPSCLDGWDMRRAKKCEIVDIGEMKKVHNLNKSVEAFINLSPSFRKAVSVVNDNRFFLKKR